MIGKTGFALLVGISLAAATSLQAQGILFVQEETRNGKKETSRIQMDQTKMRAESHADGNNAVLFDSGAEVIRMLDLEKKTYTELSRAEIERMGQQVGAALGALGGGGGFGGGLPQMSPEMQQQMAAALQQLQNMPPEQRAQMEAMLGQSLGGRGMPAMPSPGMARGGAPAAGSVQYRKTGTDKVGQWTCTKYEGYRGQEKVREVCAADPQALQLKAADFDVARKLAEFMKTLSPQAAAEMIVPGTEKEQGYEGIPVRQITFSGGQVVSSMEVKELRRETFPASVFEVPSGFRRETLGGRGGR